jgi:prepilin-type N-terminal cleavage/methylation domain-containing protein
MTRIRRRSGFSLAEALVAMVILGVISAALTRMVVEQMRFFDNAQSVRSARSAARNSMQVMLSDLRMVEADSAGVRSATTSSITVRVPYRQGIVCGTAASKTTVSMVPVDSEVGSMAVYAGYAYRPRGSTGLYNYPSGATTVTASSQPTVCTTTAGIKTISMNGRTGEIFDLTPVITMDASANVVGIAVFFYQTVTYSFAASTLYPGYYGLWRTVAGGTTEELMAPFKSTSGFMFYTAGADASTSAVPSPLSNITGVDVVLYAVGSRTPAGRTTPPEQKMITSVFFKNFTP